MNTYIVKTLPLYRVDESKVEYAVIAARHEDKLVFCRRHGYTTWEMPGGHREGKESVLETAKRELYEETGAAAYRIAPLCGYTVDRGDSIDYGVLFVADIYKFGELPEYEIEEIRLFDETPHELTFPRIQAKLSVISARHELLGGMGKDISIRRAQYIDVADIVELYHPVPEKVEKPKTEDDDDFDDIIRIEEEFRKRTTEHLLRTTIEQKNRRVFIAFDGIRPIGVLELRLLTKNIGREEIIEGGDIEQLMVRKANRRSGIGRHLNDCAMEFMKELGCSYAIVWIPAADEQLCKMASLQGYEYDGTHEMTDKGTKLRYRRSLD